MYRNEVLTDNDDDVRGSVVIASFRRTILHVTVDKVLPLTSPTTTTKVLYIQSHTSRICTRISISTTPPIRHVRIPSRTFGTSFGIRAATLCTLHLVTFFVSQLKTRHLLKPHLNNGSHQLPYLILIPFPILHFLSASFSASCVVVSSPPHVPSRPALPSPPSPIVLSEDEQCHSMSYKQPHEPTCSLES